MAEIHHQICYNQSYIHSPFEAVAQHAVIKLLYPSVCQSSDLVSISKPQQN